MKSIIDYFLIGLILVFFLYLIFQSKNDEKRHEWMISIEKRERTIDSLHSEIDSIYVKVAVTAHKIDSLNGLIDTLEQSIDFHFKLVKDLTPDEKSELRLEILNALDK
jgi:peptidoglycan hydrolase CwlO-like protein